MITKYHHWMVLLRRLKGQRIHSQPFISSEIHVRSPQTTQMLLERSSLMFNKSIMIYLLEIGKFMHYLCRRNSRITMGSDFGVWASDRCCFAYSIIPLLLEHFFGLILFQLGVCLFC